MSRPLSTTPTPKFRNVGNELPHQHLSWHSVSPDTEILTNCLGIPYIGEMSRITDRHATLTTVGKLTQLAVSCYPVMELVSTRELKETVGPVGVTSWTTY